MSSIIWFVIIFSFFGLNRSVKNENFIKVTKMECACPNPNYCSVEKCHPKPVSRNVAQLTVNISLHQRPVTNCKVHVDTYRKYTNTLNGFPFNTTFDACGFLKNSVRIPILNRVYSMMANKSNVIHACPYNEPYVYIENVTTPFTPFFNFWPSGNYLFRTKWVINDVLWFTANIWFDMINLQNTFLS